MDKDFYNSFFEKIFSGKTDGSKDAVMSVARMLSTEHLDESNAYLYLKIIKFNSSEASDIIFSKRMPDSFFSVIEPFHDLVAACMDILVSYRPDELLIKNTYACMGVLQMTYKNARYGFKVYRFSVSDIQHIGKYFVLDDRKLNDIILDILNDIWSHNHDIFKDASLKAREIADVFLDGKKKLSDAIPDVIF